MWRSPRRPTRAPTPCPDVQPEPFGAYTLLRRIATGGTAEIFLARRHGVDGFARHLAIKRILPHLANDPDFVQLLLDEARLAAHLHHGHIIEIHEVGVHGADPLTPKGTGGGQAYIAMEYLPGTDLGRLLRAARERRRTILVVWPEPAASAALVAALAAALGDRVELIAVGSLAAAEQVSGLVDLAVVEGHLLGPVRDPFLHRLQSAHPELLRTVITGESAGRGQGPYVLVAPTAEPADLARLVERLLVPVLPLELALQVVRAVADALAYAHQACDFEGQPLRIVHRDVNPSNVLVSVGGTIKLVDFGIARATTSRRDEGGAFIGTFHYMSPEQARGRPVDARSDIFALGLLLFELVSGVHPFRRDDQFATLRAIRELQLPDLAEVLPGVPPVLAAIAQRACAKDPAERFAHAGELLAALEDVLRQESFNLSPRRLEGFLRVAFTAEEVLAFGVTTTGTLPRIRLPQSPPAVPAPPPAQPPAQPPVLPPRPPPAEVDVDLADLEAPPPPALPMHPLDRLRGVEAPPAMAVRGDRGLKIVLVVVVLALAALAFWYLHWRAQRPLEEAQRSEAAQCCGVQTNPPSSPRWHTPSGPFNRHC